MMVGAREIPEAHAQRMNGWDPGRAARLVVDGLVVEDDAGLVAVDHVSLAVRPGEIVGIAGVSGNGQRELVEALIGQRVPAAGRGPRGRPALPRHAGRDPLPRRLQPARGAASATPACPG